MSSHVMNNVDVGSSHQVGAESEASEIQPEHERGTGHGLD